VRSRHSLLNACAELVKLPLKSGNPFEVPVLHASHFNQEAFNPGETLRDGLHHSNQNTRSAAATSLFLRGHSVDSPLT
jgi:hypothetical protein